MKNQQSMDYRPKKTFECCHCNSCCKQTTGIGIWPWEIPSLKSEANQKGITLKFLNSFGSIAKYDIILSMNLSFPRRGCQFFKENSCLLNEKKPLTCQTKPLHYFIPKLHDAPFLESYIHELDSCKSEFWQNWFSIDQTLRGKKEMDEFCALFSPDIQLAASMAARVDAIDQISVLGLTTLGGADCINPKSPLPLYTVMNYLGLIPIDFVENMANFGISQKALDYLDQVYALLLSDGPLEIKNKGIQPRPNWKIPKAFFSH